MFAATVGVTVSVAVPDMLVSCVEVAVTVTDVLPLTIGAVSRPDEDICPALALHVTVELKLPVPETMAEHWLVCPDETVDGVHDAVTDVIVGVLPPPLLLPPPQATISPRLPKASTIPNLCTTFLLQRTALA